MLDDAILVHEHKFVFFIQFEQLSISTFFCGMLWFPTRLCMLCLNCQSSKTCVNGISISEYGFDQCIVNCFSMKTLSNWNGCPNLWRNPSLVGASPWRKWSSHPAPPRRTQCTTNSRHQAQFRSSKAAAPALVGRPCLAARRFTSPCLVGVLAASVHAPQPSIPAPPCSSSPPPPPLLARTCSLMSSPPKPPRIPRMLPSLNWSPRCQSKLLGSLRRRRKSSCHLH